MDAHASCKHDSAWLVGLMIQVCPENPPCRGLPGELEVQLCREKQLCNIVRFGLLVLTADDLLMLLKTRWKKLYDAVVQQRYAGNIHQFCKHHDNLLRPMAWLPLSAFETAMGCIMRVIYGGHRPNSAPLAKVLRALKAHTPFVDGAALVKHSGLPVTEEKGTLWVSQPLQHTAHYSTVGISIPILIINTFYLRQGTGVRMWPVLQLCRQHGYLFRNHPGIIGMAAVLQFLKACGSFTVQNGVCSLDSKSDPSVPFSGPHGVCATV